MVEMKYEKVAMRSNTVVAAALSHHWRLVLPSIQAVIRFATVSPVSGADTATLGLEEGQQVGVELVLVRVGQAVGCPWIDLQGRVLDELR